MTSEAMRDLISDFKAERAVLKALMLDLSPGGWDVPSPAEGWSLRDCVSHLAEMDDRAAAICQGREPPPGDAVGVLTRRQREAQSRSPDEMRRWYDDAGDGLVQAMGSMDGSERLPWAGRDMGARSFLTARLMEHWSHGLDIHDAAGVTPVDTDRLRHIATLGVLTRDFSYRNRGLEPPSSPFFVELTAPSGAIWRWGHEEAVERIMGPAGDFCRLVNQRIHRDDTALVTSGAEAERYLTIAQAFAGPSGAGRPPRQRA